MPSVSPEVVNIELLTEEAFSNRNTTQDARGRRLLVDIHDEDGYAGWTAQLHFLGIVETDEALVVEADYPNSRERLQQVIRVSKTSGEITLTSYLNGQADPIPGDAEKGQRHLKQYLGEAKDGVKIGILSSKEPAFLSPELKSEVVDDDKKGE